MVPLEMSEDRKVVTDRIIYSRGLKEIRRSQVHRGVAFTFLLMDYGHIRKMLGISWS